MLLMVEVGIRGGISHAIHQYAKANNKYMKDYVKIKNFHILSIGIWIIFVDELSQKLPVDDFSWLKIHFSLMKIS